MSGHRAGRDAVRDAVRTALASRAPAPHPGPFEGGRPGRRGGDPLHLFTRHFLQAGGEVFVLRDRREARDWLNDVLAGFGPVAVGGRVPEHLRPPEGRTAPVDRAEVGISLARGAVAETGSLLLDADDDRRVQLLPPVHLVWVPGDGLHASLAGALAAVAPHLTSALALHSGPSKSADIGQILVRGVHGPGRVLAAFLLDGV